MKNKIIYSILAVVFLFGIISFAEASVLGKFEQDSNVNLLQTCSNCSFVNITAITDPSSNFIIQGQFSMTKNGNVFNYSFNQTHQLGVYIYSSCGDFNGVYTCGNTDFEIIASSVKLDPAPYLRLDFTNLSTIIIILMLLGLSAFFFWNGIVVGSSVIVLVVGFLFLYNNVNLIVSVITIIGGIAIGFMGGDK